MQTDKKPSDLSNQSFDMSKSFNKMYRTGSLHGRLNMIKDMLIFLAKEEIEVKKEIEENEKLWFYNNHNIWNTHKFFMGVPKGTDKIFLAMEIKSA